MTSETPKIKQLFDDLVREVDNDLKDFIPLQKMSSKFNFRPAHIVLIFLALVMFLTLFDIFAHIFVTTFGMLYPAYMSFKAIKQNNDEDRKKWLTYWIVFGFVTAFDTILNLVLFFVPCYYTLKAIFYIWMFYPKTNGATVIYSKFLRPQLLKVQEVTKKYKEN